MKNFILSAFIFILGYSVSGAQNTENIVKEIRAEYALINKNLKSYKKISYSTTDEYGFSTNYIIYKENNIVRLVIIMSPSDDVFLKTEYFYKNDQLFFAFVTSEGTYDSIHNSQNRYYFSNNTMVRWIDNSKKNVPTTSKEFKEAAESNLTHAQKVFKEASAKQ